MTKLVDLTGKKFGKLTVVKRSDNIILPSGKQIVAWNCICDCGNEIIARGDYLRSGITRHCGCNRKGTGEGKPIKLNNYVILNDFVIGFATNTHNEFYIDVDDFDKIKKYSWYENDNGYLVSRINNKIIRMHRLIMAVKNGLFIDHINHNTLDNRKNNLRIVTSSQNNMNKRLQCNNNSGISGVSWDKREEKWRAYIKINGNQKELGYYNIFEDAVKARKEAENKYFGEYSYDNSIERIV